MWLLLRVFLAFPHSKFPHLMPSAQSQWTLVSLAKYKLFNRNEMCCNCSQKFEWWQCLLEMTVSVPCSDFCYFWELLVLHIFVGLLPWSKNGLWGKIMVNLVAETCPEWRCWSSCPVRHGSCLPNTRVKTFTVLLPLQLGLWCWPQIMLSMNSV